MTLYDGNGPVEEPLAARVLRQVRSGVLDEDRLLPPDDKRRREIEKKLDRLSERSGWYTFVAGQAHAVATGKATARRNAEVMAVREIMRWRSEVERFTPARLAEFEAGIAHALAHPAPLPKRQTKAGRVNPHAGRRRMRERGAQP